MEWKPILTGEDEVRAWRFIGDVATAIEGYAFQSFSLADGETSAALLYHFLSKAKPDAGYEEKAEKFFLLASERLANEESTPRLYAGFTGVSFAGELMVPTVDPESDPNEEIDNAVLDFLEQEPWEDEYDLISGLVGLGVYALERPCSKNSKIVERVAEHLATLSVEHPKGLTWLTEPYLLMPSTQKQYPEGYYNFGLSHGIPGIIGFLARTIEEKAGSREKFEPLLERAVGGLLPWELPAKTTENDSRGSSTFSAHAAKNGDAGHYCRTAWCYGDPGVASALWLAGRALSREDWKNTALRLIRNAARLTPAQALIQDIGICHGTSGLAHIYNRFYQETKEPLLADAARRYLTETFRMLRPGGVAGVFEYSVNNFETMVTDYHESAGLLTGAIGVALVALSSVTDIEPTWDRFLLLSGKRNA